MARAGRDAAQKAGNQLDLASALSVRASVLWLKGNREEAAASAEDAAARFEQFGHPARALQIRKNLKKKAPFLSTRAWVGCPERRILSQVRFSRRRERDMSSRRSLDLLCTNSLTPPRRLTLFADSAPLGPTDAELRGIEVSRNLGVYCVSR